MTSINHPVEQLHNACAANDLLLVQQLIESGVEKEAKNSEGCTPLHTASAFGHVNIVDYLGFQNANLEAINNYNQTPLHLACLNNRLETVRCLALLEANLETLDSNNRTLADMHVSTVILRSYKNLLLIMLIYTVHYILHAHMTA